ncbi:nucleoplasmin-like protein NO29 [Bombina bombina]|uniref:nucleoplasmin-like protein NO29 n=1 Tax=Bombina bombina TaxID=8345 RepID=UPI00235AEE04|nr:nucleoplasmin-like protein NO29 [Bombina bombina]
MNTISLGDSAKDEYNVVEVIAHNREEEEVAAQVANLKLSCQPMVDVDCFTLHPPVMFRLKSGSGPVLIAGQHLITRNADEDLSDSETKESSTEDEEEEEETFAPIKPANKKLRVI